jgi:hypothetical protein
MSDFYMLELFTAANGKMDCLGTMTIEDGDIYLLDLGRAFTSQFSAGSGLPLVLPRAPLDRALGGQPLDGLILKAGLPVTRLISDLIMSLDRLPSMGIAVALAIEEAVTTLLVSVISNRTIDELPEDPVLSRIFRQRVLQFIDANLHRPDLDLALLMQQFRVSRAISTGCSPGTAGAGHHPRQAAECRLPPDPFAPRQDRFDHQHRPQVGFLQQQSVLAGFPRAVWRDAERGSG